MEDKELIIFKIVLGLVLLLIYLAISWHLYYRLHFRPDSQAEAQALLIAAHREIPRQRDAQPRLPRDANNNQPGLRHRNSRENNLTSNTANNSHNESEENSNNEIANNSQNQGEGNGNEIANSSQNQSKEKSKITNDDHSPNSDRRGVWYISDDESIFAYGVHGHVKSIDINNNIITNDADREMNNGATTCARKATNSIFNDEGGSRDQGLSEDIHVNENVEDPNDENKNDDTTENSSE